jgi:acylphosphatase
MEQRKCFAFTVKNKVQNVGLRLDIAKLIPDELDVRTDNMPDGSVRVVVKGYKKEVMEFWERLQKQVLDKAENPTFSQPAGMAEMSIETDRFFHKLQCEQMEEFVDVGLDMKGSIDSMSGKIDNMSSKIDHMSSKLDTLPENMAKELAKLKKNGLL